MINLILIFFLTFSTSISAVNKLKIGIVSGSNDISEKSLGSEMYCMAKAFSVEFQNDYDITLLNNRRSLEGTLKSVSIINEKNIDIVIGAANSTESQPLADNAFKYKYYAPLSTNPDLLKLNKNTFLFNSSDQVIANQLYLQMKSIKGKRIGFVTNISSNYSKYLTKKISEKLQNKKGNFFFNFIEGNQNKKKFKSFIVKNNINTLIFPIHASRATFFYNVLKEIGREYIIYGADGIGGRAKFLKSINPTSTKIKFYFIKSWRGHIYSESPYYDLFYKFKKKYCPKKSNSLVLAIMFDTLNFVLNNTVSKKNYYGITGRHSFKGNISNRDIYLFQVIENKALFVKTLSQ